MQGLWGSAGFRAGRRKGSTSLGWCRCRRCRIGQNGYGGCRSLWRTQTPRGTQTSRGAAIGPIGPWHTGSSRSDERSWSPQSPRGPELSRRAQAPGGIERFLPIPALWGPCFVISIIFDPLCSWITRKMFRVPAPVQDVGEAKREASA
ncbi:MAG: hypothetical protein LBJ48_01595 [Coriobacteriales bacterium]|nr:hypothetical protein [Coriobacteriales bacterium]